MNAAGGVPAQVGYHPRVRWALPIALLITACPGPSVRTQAPVATAPEVAAHAQDELPEDPVVISIVGTNDLHGQIRALPVLGGTLANLRQAREDDGGVLLVDAGDMWQGTLESNLEEGAPVVTAYELLGYDAVAIGNHEFDFGPVGPASTVGEGESDDPRGALRARATSATFPFLLANVVETDTKQAPKWDNVVPTAMVDVAGVSVGVVGLTTIDTAQTTIAANFVGLEVLPLAPVVVERSAQLRAQGAAAIVVVAHAGGRCRELDDPDDLSSCDLDQEVFRMIDDLPSGTVDVVVAGHTHAGIAHRHSGVAVIESLSHGRALGRVDLRVDRSSGRVEDVRIHPPRILCREGRGESCVADDYEGKAVVPDARVAQAIAPALASAAQLEGESLSVVLATPIPRAYDRESPLGNLVADLMREAKGADVAVTNGGGLRADLPQGPLTYGALYEALPFDNRLAHIRMTAGALTQVIAENLRRDRSILSVSGVRVLARCRSGALVVQLRDTKGRPIPAQRSLHVVTSDFLATGGDAFAPALEPGAVTLETQRPLRDELADLLRKRGGTLSAKQAFDPAEPRLSYPGKRPIACPPD
jgi:2',3'-cyclic-nucleotide 2'-phosphodiesterase (5'-nucleotidase family)